MTLKPYWILSGLLLLVNCSLWGQEIGLQLYSLREQFRNDPVSTMQSVRAMGFKHVEMTETYGLSFPQFIKLLAQNEISVVSFGTTYEDLERDPQAVADAARSYGARYIVCYWIPHEGPFTKSDADKASEVLNSAGKKIAENGLLLCYHPHGYEFLPDEKETVFDYLVRRLTPGLVYLQMDVFWIKQAGLDPVTLLKRYPTRFVSLHLKDRKSGSPHSDNGKADPETNVVLGSGDVGIDEIYQAANDLGLQFFFIEDESSRAEEQIPRSLDYLKNLNPQTRK